MRIVVELSTDSEDQARELMNVIASEIGFLTEAELLIDGINEKFIECGSDSECIAILQNNFRGNYLGPLSLSRLQERLISISSEVVVVEEDHSSSIETLVGNLGFDEDFLLKHFPFRNFQLEQIWNEYSTGKNVTVAVIDNGCGDHSQFNGRLCEESVVPRNTPSTKHGESMCLAIGAQLDGLRNVGIAISSRLLSIKAGGFEIRSSDLTRALCLAICRKVDIINVSNQVQAISSHSSALQCAVESNIIVLSSAGTQNPMREIRSNQFCSLKKVLTIGSAEKNNAISLNSNYSKEYLDFYVFGAFWNKNLGSTCFKGTSYACAYASAVVAMVRSISPNLSASDFLQLVKVSGHDVIYERIISARLYSHFEGKRVLNALGIFETFFKSSTKFRTVMSKSRVELKKPLILEGVVNVKANGRKSPGEIIYNTITGEKLIPWFARKPTAEEGDSVYFLEVDSIDSSDKEAVLVLRTEDVDRRLLKIIWLRVSGDPGGRGTGTDSEPPDGNLTSFANSFLMVNQGKLVGTNEALTPWEVAYLNEDGTIDRNIGTWMHKTELIDP